VIVGKQKNMKKRRFQKNEYQGGKKNLDVRSSHHILFFLSQSAMLLKQHPAGLPKTHP
jgi:hypothetical protein